MRRVLLLVVAMVCTGLTAGLTAAFIARDPSGVPSSAEAGAIHQADFEFEIPAGSPARARAGERLNLMPSRLNVKVGQTLRLINLDPEGVVVNGFYVGGYEILTQRFSSPGVLKGTCWATDSGTYEIVVKR